MFKLFGRDDRFFAVIVLGVFLKRDVVQMSEFLHIAEAEFVGGDSDVHVFAEIDTSALADHHVESDIEFSLIVEKGSFDVLLDDKFFALDAFFGALDD